MKTLLCVFILLFIILVLLFPIKLKGAIHLNILDDVGFGAIKIFTVKVFCAKFTLKKNGKLEMKSAVKKKKKKKNISFKIAYFKSMMSFIDIKKIQFYFDGGLNDAYYSCLTSGYISSFLAAIYGYLISKYKHIKINSYVTPYFNEKRLEVSGAIVLSFNLLQILISIIYGYISYLKNKKEG